MCMREDVGVGVEVDNYMNRKNKNPQHMAPNANPAPTWPIVCRFSKIREEPMSPASKMMVICKGNI